MSRILYPDDTTPQGKELRFKQQYFFVSASLQDILAQHLAEGRSFESLPDAIAIQLNDTHPALAITELMRLLVDEHEVDWERAWAITRRVFSYTNHTLLPEALEVWPVAFLRAAAAAPPADHLPDQPRAARRGVGAVSQRPRTPPAPVADRRVARPHGAHGAPRRRRQPHGQRRGEAAFGADDADDLRGVRRALSRPLHQRHERHRRAALAEAVEPRTFAAVDAPPRARLGKRPRGTRAPALGRRRCRVPARVPRHQARQQAAARCAKCSGASAIDDRREFAVRRAGQAHPRVQAAAAEPAVRRDALPPLRAESGRVSRCRARCSSPARRRPAT